MAPGITGMMMATQLLKIILNMDNILSQKLLVFNLKTDRYLNV